MHKQYRFTASLLKTNLLSRAYLFGWIALLTLSFQTHSAATKSQWAKSDANSTTVVDHRPLSQILTLIEVKERNKTKVAYTRLGGRALEYAKAYIRLLESIPVSTLNRNEQLAYWLNLHNIGVITLIAETRNGHKKMKKLRGTPNNPGEAWTAETLTVEGQPLSLQDIEQKILLRQWRKPSTLYGIYYGVQGSPEIGKVAFSGSTVHDQLAKRAKAFINSERNIKKKRSGLELSRLYEWHGDALFDGSEQKLIEHFKQYAEPRLRSALASSPPVSKYRFSWKSNAFIPRQHPTSLGNESSYRGAGS